MCAEVLEVSKTQERRTLERAVDIFLRDRKGTVRGIAADTEQTYKVRLGTFTAWAENRGLQFIDEVDADVIDSFFIHLRDERRNPRTGEPLSDNTIRDYFLSLRAFSSTPSPLPNRSRILRQVLMNPSEGSVVAAMRSTMEIRHSLPRAVLVGCVSRKLSHRAHARDLYTSDLFRKRRAYAEASGHAWFILSAKHGLVRPDTMLDPYDETLDHVPRTVLLGWGENAVSALERILGPLAGQMVEIHAGKRYVEGVEAALRSRDAKFAVPLKGRRIGEQLAWYKRMLKVK